MVIAGLFNMDKTKWKITRNICVASLITYSPMIWQRFNFKYDVDWVGFKFDGALGSGLTFHTLVRVELLDFMMKHESKISKLTIMNRFNRLG